MNITLVLIPPIVLGLGGLFFVLRPNPTLSDSLSISPRTLLLSILRLDSAVSALLDLNERIKVLSSDTTTL